ncbi:pyridoxamine 5'-phosphate oxidase family protein [Mycolicibacterium sp. 624]|uniref:pyridoxamine 5'-phosphate oxidase family protein n=1 Tax=Mycolicibacterium sp. 624 TaxID=3156314 RepID=UPI003393C038
MSQHYGTIAFTDAVREAQKHYGSDAFYTSRTMRARAIAGPDPLTEDVREFLSERDGFYLASVSQTGWPYVQFRGGPVGFIRVLDDHTLGWADFQGNLQYISTGNVTADDRVALFAMDYPHRRRLKIFGHARITTVEEDAALVESLTVPEYDAVVERAVVVSVEAFDWNCQQHITPRFSAVELEPRLAALRDEVASLRRENEELRRRGAAG